MGWINAEATKIFVGDAVRFTVWCSRIGPEGKTLYKVVNGREKPVEAPVRIAGRIVDHGSSEDVRDGLWIERTHAAWNGDLRVPRVLDLYARHRLRDVERLEEEGSPRRNDYSGRLNLRDKLRRAAGGDETVPAAVARVAACVHPSEAAIAQRESRLPYRLGVVRARAMLDGLPTTPNSRGSEAVLRQLDGRMPIPEAQDRTKV